MANFSTNIPTKIRGPAPEVIQIFQSEETETDPFHLNSPFHG